MECKWPMILQNHLERVNIHYVVLMEELWWVGNTQEWIDSTALFKWMIWHSSMRFCPRKKNTMLSQHTDNK